MGGSFAMVIAPVLHPVTMEPTVFYNKERCAPSDNSLVGAKKPASFATTVCIIRTIRTQMRSQIISRSRSTWVRAVTFRVCSAKEAVDLANTSATKIAIGLCAFAFCVGACQKATPVEQVLNSVPECLKAKDSACLVRLMAESDRRAYKMSDAQWVRFLDQEFFRDREIVSVSDRPTLDASGVNGEYTFQVKDSDGVVDTHGIKVYADDYGAGIIGIPVSIIFGNAYLKERLARKSSERVMGLEPVVRYIRSEQARLESEYGLRGFHYPSGFRTWNEIAATMDEALSKSRASGLQEGDTRTP